LNTLDLLLEANTLRQHAKFLVDRLLWLYGAEVEVFVEAFIGDLSFKARILVILGIILVFGALKWMPILFEGIILYVLLKHSSFGYFFKECYEQFKGFIDLLQFYEDYKLKLRSFPEPFKYEKNGVLCVEIVERFTEDGGVYFTNSSDTLKISTEQIHEMKPILELMSLTISFKEENHLRSKIWRWEKWIKYDYGEEEWAFFKEFRKHLPQK